MNPYQFALLSLASYRLTRLWRYDAITEPFRSRIIGSQTRTGFLLSHPNKVSLWLLDLLECQWCVAVHVTFWASGAATLTGWTRYPAGWAGAAGFVVSWMALAATAAWCFGIESRLFGVDD